MNLRELFIQWLTGSQYLRHLEEELSILRMDFSQRLTEKDSTIKGLRIELHASRMEADRMRMVLMPLGSPAGQMYAAKFQPKPADLRIEEDLSKYPGALDWQGELNQMLKEEEDGIRGGGRIQEHKPSSNDGA